MTVKELMEQQSFEVINGDGDTSQCITTPFCCDLLSIAMGKALAGAAWVTVMGNTNTIAVATLTEVAVVILAEGVEADEMAIKRAKEHGVIVLRSTAPIFETAYEILKRINA